MPGLFARRGFARAGIAPVVHDGKDRNVIFFDAVEDPVREPADQTPPHALVKDWMNLGHTADALEGRVNARDELITEAGSLLLVPLFRIGEGGLRLLADDPRQRHAPPCNR